MADNNKNILEPSLDQVTEGNNQLPSKSSILTHTKTALAMGFLALSITGPATAQTSVVSSAISAKAPSAKESGQEIILKDGTKMSFMDIKSEKDPEKKKAILDGMTDDEYDKYDKFLENSKQIAINRVSSEKEGEKMAIKEGDQVAERKQMAINQGIALDMEIITKLELIAKLGKPLSQSDKKYLENIVQSKTPPVDRLAQSLLKTARFALDNESK